MGYEKNMSFLVIPKSQKVRKKVEQIGLGSFKTIAYTTFSPAGLGIRQLYLGSLQKGNDKFLFCTGE